MPHKDREAGNKSRRDGKRRLRLADPEKYRAVGRAEAALRRERHPERERAGVRSALRKMWAEDPELMRLAARRQGATRRARKEGAFVEDVDPAVVLKRDGGICGICREPITGAWHVDHVVPLARGGEHSYRNTQAAHPLCNFSKGARLPEGVSL